MIYKNVRNQGVVAEKVNSSQRQRNDDKYFRDFVSDCIKQLESEGKAICMNKEQLAAVSSVLKVEATYNEIYDWWDLKYVTKSKTKKLRMRAN